MRIEKEGLEERSFSMDIEQEVVDTYYDALEIRGTSSEEAIYTTKELTGLDVAQIEQILMKSGILESIEEAEDKKKDDDEEEEEEEEKVEEAGYKKKDDDEEMEEEVDENIITVVKEFTIPGTDIILEKGDKFRVIVKEEKEDDDKKDSKSDVLDSIMKKVSDGKELTAEEKKTLSAAIDASKGKKD